MPVANRSIDRRVARTRAMLHDALIALVMEKGYESITVEDICKRANVGRSTFYGHYTGKDDLMRSGFRHLREDLLRRRSDVESSSSAENRPLMFTRAIFEQGRAHLHIHRTLAGGRGGTLAFSMVRETLCELVRSEIKPAAGEKDSDAIPRELVVQYLVGAYMAVLTWWLGGGAKLAPHRIDAMFQRLAKEGIGDLGR